MLDRSATQTINAESLWIKDAPADCDASVIGSLASVLCCGELGRFTAASVSQACIRTAVPGPPPHAAFATAPRTLPGTRARICDRIRPALRAPARRAGRRPDPTCAPCGFAGA